jgi:spectinomycin phosphotransferase
MLEKPDISDEIIISRLNEEYNVRAAELTFLPLGADEGSAVYRLMGDDGTAYFLKLRRGFDEISVTVPLFLRSQGVREIIVPFETRSKQGWADFGEYTMILYPYIEGNNGFEMELSDSQKRAFGASLQRIHTTKIPPELRGVIPHETFSPQWRERVRDLQRQVENGSFREPIAAKLANFIRATSNEIGYLITRTGELAAGLQSRSHELVLCHTDVHGANLLITNNDRFYIVDWDAPLLAPKERDLMFVGGGIDTLWESERDESLFYEGYGNVILDLPVLAYYRYERVIEDLAAYGEQLLLTEEGGADREQAYRRFMVNFAPGQTIEIARKTDELAGI